MTEQEFTELKQHKQKLISKHQVDLKYLLSKCQHWTFKTKETYTEGGYDYYSETVTWKQCTCCGFTKDQVTKQGRHFS